MQGLALVRAQAQTLIQSGVHVQGYPYREVPHFPEPARASICKTHDFGHKFMRLYNGHVMVTSGPNRLTYLQVIMMFRR